jgi:sugar lactone lactonase YvrE
MNSITSFLSRQFEEKKFFKTMVLVTAAVLILFITLYMFNMKPAVQGPVLPGTKNLTFSHFIYGGHGEDAFSKPMYATFGNNLIYVSDSNNHRVQIFKENGDPVSMFGGRGIEDGKFFFPYGIVVGPDGNVYVADMYRNDIQIFSKNGEFLNYFVRDRKDLVDGPAMMHLDEKGRLFVANVNSSQVTVFDLKTGDFLQSICVIGDVFAPNGVTVDENGFIYVVDTGNARVVVYNPDGSKPVRLINGSEDGRGQSLLSNPRGIAVYGNQVFVVSNLTHYIYIFDKTGKEISTFGGLGDQQNQFIHPNGLSMDKRGWVLITDSTGGRVAVYK